MYETLCTARHWIVQYMYHNKNMYILTLKQPESGATTSSNNSLRLTQNMHTLKQPERGATTPSNNSIRLTQNIHTLKQPGCRLLATIHSSQIIYFCLFTQAYMYNIIQAFKVNHDYARDHWNSLLKCKHT